MTEINAITADYSRGHTGAVHLFVGGKGFIARNITTDPIRSECYRGWDRKTIDGNIVSLHSGFCYRSGEEGGEVSVIALASDGRIWDTRSKGDGDYQWFLNKDATKVLKLVVPKWAFEIDVPRFDENRKEQRPDHVDVFAIDEHGALKHRMFWKSGHGDWHVFKAPAGTRFVDATAYYTAPNHIDVIGIDVGGGLHHWTSSGVMDDRIQWSERLNEMDHAPRMRTLTGHYNRTSRRTELFGLGFHESALYHTWLEDGHWVDWTYGRSGAPRLHRMELGLLGTLNLVGLSPAGTLYRTRFDYDHGWLEWTVNFCRAPRNIKQVAFGSRQLGLFALSRESADAAHSIHVIIPTNKGSDGYWKLAPGLPPA